MKMLQLEGIYLYLRNESSVIVKILLKQLMKKYLLLISLFIILSNCDKVNCDKSAEYYRKMDVNFVIIEKKALNHGREVNFKIKNIKNNEFENYNEENTWFAWYYANFEKGDTITKHKGELVFSIHKKDTVLSFNFECDGKKYLR